ncbi:MAG: SGNH/GDSL hydrolase family protein [Paracoccaceae bacterium]
MIDPRALPDGALRIVAFGTSLTARSPWPDELADRLGTCLGRPVEIQRVAQPGATARWAASAKQIAAVVDASPDLVLVEFAVNDADLREGVSRAEADRLMRAALQALAEALTDATLVEMTMSPARGWRGVSRPGLAAYYSDAVARAEERGGGLVDFYRRWTALPRSERGLADGIHPDPDVAAAVIVAPLAAYVAAGFEASCPEGQLPERS